MQVQKTVFISYRRTNPFHALAIYQHLDTLGYDVFYDVDSLRGGDWLQAIIENIKARAHFLIILTPSAIERFNEPGDVMRQEIETAIDTQRNIIPLIMEDFDFKQAETHLTGKLAVLPRYNGLEIPARFFRYAMQELHEKHLQQDVTTIIHPLSFKASTVAQEQQAAATAAPPVTERQLSAEEYFERACQAVENWDYDGALADFTEALRLNPQLAEAWNNRGIARRVKGDLDGALADYAEALRLNPQLVYAYNNRGEAWFVLQHFSDALADFQRANELQPAHNIILSGMAVTHHALGELQQARAIWQRLLRLDTRYHDANWVGKENNWHPSLIEEARKLIAAL